MSTNFFSFDRFYVGVIESTPSDWNGPTIIPSYPGDHGRKSPEIRDEFSAILESMKQITVLFFLKLTKTVGSSKIIPWRRKYPTNFREIMAKSLWMMLNV